MRRRMGGVCTVVRPCREAVKGGATVRTRPLIALSAATFLGLAGCAVDCSAVCQAGNRELAAIPIPPSSSWHADGGLEFTSVDSKAQWTRNRWYQRFRVTAPPSQIDKQ